MTRPLVLSGTALTLLMIAGRAGAQQGAPIELDTLAITPAMVSVGRAIFHGKGTCFVCHGAKLEGSQVAPTLVKKVWKDAKSGDFQSIYDVISHGVSSTLMVAFPGGVSRTDAMSVAAYIWSVNNRKEKP
jgi:mono/diheme cytochrome c family protein